MRVRAVSDDRVSELSDRLCECGCGLPTFVSPKTRRSKGWVKGEPRRFRYGHHRRPGSDFEVKANGFGRWDGTQMRLFAALDGATLEMLRERERQRRRLFAKPIGPPRVCACGCGRSVGSLSARWLQGHDKRREIGPEYVVDRETGCWVWQRRVDASGYGRLRRDGRDAKAHRVFYEERHGEGSALGLEVHHECGEKLCVNPDHLSALAPEEHHRIHGDMAREMWRLQREAA